MSKPNKKSKSSGQKTNPAPAPPESAAPKQPSAPGPDAGRVIPRVVSLIMLVAVVLLVTAMFFRVMLQFVAPLFLAGVLVVIFEPIHKRVMARLPGKPKLAALATTLLVAFSVIIPITWLGVNAFFELTSVVKPFVQAAAEDPADTGLDDAGPGNAGPGNAGPAVAEPGVDLAVGDGADGDGAAGDDANPVNDLIDRVRLRAAPYIDWYETNFQQDFDTQLRTASSQAAQTLLSTGIHTVLSVIGFLFGLGIMAFALYYFLADGPAMVEAFLHLSPLDDDYERELLEKFAEVSRAVVIATLLSAAAQGLLAGVGYYFALDGGPIFLLTAVTMLMAIVPFVGATIIWIPVVAWVYFVQGDTAWAIGLGLWCVVVVSNIDNLIKPLVLHGQSNLHPLLALLSVLGGVSVLGPVGILVGPMLVAFLQALLGMLRKELDSLGGKQVATE